MLGGGISGLAAGYYAKKAGIPFSIYEAEGEVGGLCSTLGEDGFFFDTGAHRFHDSISAVTQEVFHLMGGNFARIEIPSKIYRKGKLLHFPLSPSDLSRVEGISFLLKATWDVLKSRLNGKQDFQDFESFARYKYGDVISELFLLNYSRKLWGMRCSDLSMGISGNRLRGLSPWVFLTDLVFGKNSSKHLDGTFYYPVSGGISSIAMRLKECCGEEHIHCHSRITKIIHDFRRIEAIEIDGHRIIHPRFVLSTIPLTEFLDLLDPPPPAGVRRAGAMLKYRSLLLVILLLGRPSVTEAATVYFPEERYPFTRISEPNNRSQAMSPPQETSLVAELPCNHDDDMWRRDERELKQEVVSCLKDVGWIEERDILGSYVHRIKYAYPVIGTNTERHLRCIQNHFESFSNLRFAGRNGRFRYSHIHDHFCEARSIVETMDPNGQTKSG